MSDIFAVFGYFRCEIWISYVNLEAGESEFKTFEKNFLFHKRKSDNFRKKTYVSYAIRSIL